MKKILAVILTLTLIFSFSNVFAAGGEMVDNTDSIADFLGDLGILDGIDTSDFTREVTRGEFIAMVMRMQNMAYEGSITNEFSDVNDETPFANEIYAAKGRGIINGTAPTQFSPDRAMTYGAAIKVCTGFLGFGDLALVSGGYPAGYLSVATSIGITSGVPSGDVLTLSGAIRLIFNTLHTDINSMVGVSEGNITSMQIKGVNPLKEYFSLSVIEGIVQTAGYYSALDGYAGAEERILINGTSLYSDIKNSERLLGFYVECWYDEESSTAKAVYVKRNNKILSLIPENITGYSGFEILYDEREKAISSYPLDMGFSFVLNGRCIKPEKSDFLYKNGTMTLIDNDLDGDFDIVISERGEYFVVSGVNEYLSAIYDKNVKGSEIILKNTDKGKFELYDAQGNKCEFEDIKIGTVLNVKRSRDGFLSHLTMGIGSVKGTITECGQETLKIDGTEYKTCDYFEANYDYAPGLYAEFLLAPDGSVAAIADAEAEEMQYGYFLDYFKKSSGVSDSVLVKIRTTNNKLLITELSDKVILDGSNPLGCTSDAIKNKLTNGGYPIYQLIRYSLDEKGNVNKIDTAKKAGGTAQDKYSNKTQGEDSLTKFIDKTAIYYRDQGMAVPYFLFSGALIFRVPSELSKGEYNKRYSDELFQVGSTAHLTNGSKPIADAYDFSENFSAGAVVLYDKIASSSGLNIETPSNEAASHVVEKVVDGLDKDGGKTKVIYTYSNGSFGSYTVSGEVLSELSKKIPSKGDVIRLSLNGDGEVNGIARDVILQKDGTLKISYGEDALSDNPVNVLTYVAGKAFSADNMAITIQSNSECYPSGSGHSDRADMLSAHIYAGSVKTVIYNKDTGYIEQGMISDINTIMKQGSEYASDILLRLRYYSPSLIVIYK